MCFLTIDFWLWLQRISFAWAGAIEDCVDSVIKVINTAVLNRSDRMR
jgi:hypothetical protein